MIKELISLKGHTIKTLVSYWLDRIIAGDMMSDEVKRINQLALTKYKPSGLIRIKELAWKYFEQNSFTMLAEQLQKKQ